MLTHAVYFTLQDNSEAAQDNLIAACHHYLSGHEGTVFFAVGKLDPELVRPVNDLAFDIALYVIFADRAAHDAYQVDPRHLQFIEENRPNWKQVRVFDANAESCPV